MDIYERQVITDRITEIEHEQLVWLYYTCDKIDYMCNEQKENVRERMLQVREEKERLIIL